MQLVDDLLIQIGNFLLLASLIRLRWVSCLLTAFILSLLKSTPLAASPWIGPGDQQLRHHIQVLADAGVITVPVTTWPLMWSGIAADIKRPTQKLNNQQRWSLDYVRFEYSHQTSSSTRKTVRLGLRNEPNIIQNFSSEQREKAEFEVTHDWVGDWLAIQLDITTINDPFIASDDQRVRADGSYISALVGNWSVTLGAMDHWWGPAWGTSLILSNNARPVPGIILQRNLSTPFDSKWLSWIGPWHMTTFAGQLESDRVIEHAKLLGMRIGFKPFENLEIALSRTAQWGGEGRPQSLSSLWDVFTGDDNVAVIHEADGSKAITDEERENEPSNQLAGIDFRYHFDMGETQNSFYGQLIGEDESNFAPAKKIFLFGLSSTFSSVRSQHRFTFEAFDTAVDALDGEPLYGTAYRHSTYQSGYTHRGRQIAAWTGNDTRLVRLAASHYFDSFFIDSVVLGCVVK